MTSATIDLQNASTLTTPPSLSELTKWVERALQTEKDVELTIRIVNADESQELNHQYRGKESPTNVLSFPFEAPAEIELNLLGDLIICAQIVAAEAAEQHKTEQSHWAHMVVHGTLHLQGYDHIDDEEAEEMEQLEISILKSLGFENPYINDETGH